jgi:hypothetical protein
VSYPLFHHALDIHASFGQSSDKVRETAFDERHELVILSTEHDEFSVFPSGYRGVARVFPLNDVAQGSWIRWIRKLSGK